MTSFPWLTAIGLIPLVGAAVVGFLPARAAATARMAALAVSLVTLGVTIAAAVQYRPQAGTQFQFVERVPWIPHLGASYSLGVDGMALLMIVMSAILVPVCIVAAWDDVPEGGRRQNVYFAWMLVLEALIVGVFAATDVFLFYVFFEAMLIPVYFLIGSYGGERRRAAALKFLLYSLAGGLVMLVAVIGLYFQGPRGADGFLISNLSGLSMDPTVAKWLFVGFFIAFAVKAPMWPVHPWLPDASAQARPATSVLLVGILDKVGTYGMIRFCLQIFPEASQWAAPVVTVLALISIVYGGLLAIRQNDMLRLIAYTSVSHFGFIVLGIFSFTKISQGGSVLYMLNHGFSTAALFLVAGMLIRRGGSTLLSDYGGWQRVAPVLAGCFLVAGLSGLALPGFGSFISEFLVIMGTFRVSPATAVVASTGIILSALYILLMYQRVMTGPKPVMAQSVPDLIPREKWVVAPLIVAFVVLGFFPRPALDLIDHAVETTMQIMQVSDPQPYQAHTKASDK